MRCREWIDDEEERASHVCCSNLDAKEDQEGEEETQEGELLCPLGCPPTR